ncbi:saccharopine dehydrogenase NADP-binding domain-containing protein [Aquiflexum lacus]|uniref:saccharopine dehydrogenase NADP-binding domain-containing protein n=1 Tax=Aquiflexum lacus TaxID=2483805 RepID=UPI001893DBEA|nr:hypothetical protein [Aquiflexum lacus]
MNKKILVIGSNGILGKHIVEKLILQFGISQIIISDYKEKRILKQESQFASKFGQSPLSRVIDINSIESIKKGIYDVALVVVAIQQKNPNIQKLCLEKGINSIEVSVNPGFIEKVLDLNSVENHSSLQIITGGLFPGLSGILAKEISKNGLVDETVEVGLLQSSKGTNGKTGVLDMLKIFNSKVRLFKTNSTAEYAGFSLIKRFQFPMPFGTKELRLANFIERDYLKVAGITSNYWTAFDKQSLNSLIFVFRKLGILKLTTNKIFGNLMASMISKSSKKSIDESIGLIATNDRKSIALVLRSDYEATAVCIVAYSKSILSNKTSITGVRFPFEIFSFSEIEPDLKDVIKKKARIES